MSEDKSLAHTRWNGRYHIVFIPKCRRKEIYGTVKQDVVAIIKQL